MIFCNLLPSLNFINNRQLYFAKFFEQKVLMSIKFSIQSYLHLNLVENLIEILVKHQMT